MHLSPFIFYFGSLARKVSFVSVHSFPCAGLFWSLTKRQTSSLAGTYSFSSTSKSPPVDYISEWISCNASSFVNIIGDLVQSLKQHVAAKGHVIVRGEWTKFTPKLKTQGFSSIELSTRTVRPLISCFHGVETNQPTSSSSPEC